MRHLKWSGILAAIALSVLLTAGLVACGSSEPDESGSPTASVSPVGETETYHNDKYGFSIDYPSSKEMSVVHVSGISHELMMVPTLDPGNQPGDGVTLIRDERMTVVDGRVVFRDLMVVNARECGLMVTVRRLDEAVGPEEVPETEGAYREAVMAMVDDLPDGVCDEAGKFTEINGVPGFVSSYSATLADTRMHALSYSLFAGTYQYELLGLAAADRWDEVPPELEAIMMSFRLD